MLLNGKTALVTGASQGIGLGFVRRWLAEGAKRIWCADIVQSPALRRLCSRHPQLRYVQYDQGDQASIAQLFAQLQNSGPRLNAAALVAIYSQRERLIGADPVEIEKTIRISLTGGILVLQGVANSMMRARGMKRIVVVGSPHSQPSFAIPGCLAYNAAKAGMFAAMRTAAMELWRSGITVNEVVPGWVDTPGERKFQSEEKIRAAVKGLPAKRLIMPAEVAHVGTLFLGKEMAMVSGSSYGITGLVDAPWWSNREDGV